MNGNMTQAAKRLGVDRSALYRMIQRINTLAKAEVDGRDKLNA
jgi:transcriptional regulator of acetoin/glycerol metabolism